jgi:branched-subunit amino acid permease
VKQGYKPREWFRGNHELESIGPEGPKIQSLFLKKIQYISIGTTLTPRHDRVGFEMDIDACMKMP